MNDDSPPERDVIAEVVGGLCAPESYQVVSHRSNHDVPMPSVESLAEIVDRLRSVLFPGYFGVSHLRVETMSYYVGSTLDHVYRELTEQVRRGLCFQENGSGLLSERQCLDRSAEIADRFLLTLSETRRLLATDIQAAYDGDPAAASRGEIVFCYPSIRALTNYRIAHELHKLAVPLIPRIITEMAHSETGIDIHPGASIGESFFMDHGTGIVIGETTVIGKRVRIYQGVTLGAKSFPLDEGGKPIKGIPRHPVVEDDVIIYSGATILGRIVIGKGSEIGGNVWLTRSVPPGTRIVQGRPLETSFEQGDGI